MTNQKCTSVGFPLLIVLLSISAPAACQDYSGIVVFGSSIEDVGNAYEVTPGRFGFAAPPSPPYWMGRFSNGPNFIDLLSDHLGLERPQASELGGTNYAYGGGTSGAVDNRFGVKDLDDQLADYLETNTPSETELFVVSSSNANNDFFVGQTDPLLTWTFVENTISQLLEEGANNLLITNVRLVRPSNADFAVRYNEASASGVEALRIAHPAANIFELDVSQVFQDIATEPEAYGITDINSQACLDCGLGLNPAPTQFQDNPNQFLFWDDGHPSATAHEILGDAAFSAVSTINSVACDFNDDGSCDGMDINQLMNEASTGGADTDINGDNIVDNADRDEWLALAGAENGFKGSLLVGDSNIDGIVDATDLNVLGISWQSRDEFDWTAGNFAIDGNVGVNATDLNALGINWRKSSTIAVAVPEPAGMPLIIGILLATVFGTLKRSDG